nr:MAG TPA: hypothetical protein [Caudoviricetes sp.]
MISKELFIQLVKILQAQRLRDAEITKDLQNIAPNNHTVFTTPAIDEIVKMLDKCGGDEDWLSWWLYEDTHFITENGVGREIKTASELYDLMYSKEYDGTSPDRA